MNPETRRQLMEVFGDPTNVAPAGTGAVLTRPSKLDQEFAIQIVQALELDTVFRDLGAVVARELADEMESQGMKPSDYRFAEGLGQSLAKKIAKNIAKSEVFETALRLHLGMRG